MSALVLDGAYLVTYRVAMGSRAGQEVFSLQTVPAREEELRKGVAQYGGFSQRPKSARGRAGACSRLRTWEAA